MPTTAVLKETKYPSDDKIIEYLNAGASIVETLKEQNYSPPEAMNILVATVVMLLHQTGGVADIESNAEWFRQGMIEMGGIFKQGTTIEKREDGTFWAVDGGVGPFATLDDALKALKALDQIKQVERKAKDEAA
jgi:hypothetical protein